LSRGTIRGEKREVFFKLEGKKLRARKKGGRLVIPKTPPPPPTGKEKRIIRQAPQRGDGKLGGRGEQQVPLVSYVLT